MKNLVDHLKNLKNQAREHPFIEWLHSSDQSAKDKLRAWVPVSTVFAQMFKDFCNIGIRYDEEEIKDMEPLKAAINEHSVEDGEHYHMLYGDLELLGLNKGVQLNRFLQFFWGEKTEQMRKNGYKLISLARECKDPVLRFLLIQTIEVCGNEKFTAVAKLGEEYYKETGKRLAYFGQEHLDQEDGHLQCNANDIGGSGLLEMEVTEEQMKKAKEVIDATFSITMERWSLDLEFAKMGHVPFAP